MDNYQVFAAVYDDLMDKSLYAEWLKYVQKRVPTGQRILELASGAGDLAQRLVAEKYDLTVSDLSESMLELAASKVGGDSDTDFFAA
ncbi:class I SAM-dependent methyltransferase [Amylolactobacillus amylophilus]|uniref:class I SAM-dependent methyltransferase n=1 Tax=Amylolactobacillus amylophilus TaxID=1603 RepID=UPI0006D14B9C|nr:class I SAM-dependent methyltransferase [Amylolactobacillus amylophilus]